MKYSVGVLKEKKTKDHFWRGIPLKKGLIHSYKVDGKSITIKFLKFDNISFIYNTKYKKTYVYSSKKDLAAAEEEIQKSMIEQERYKQEYIDKVDYMESLTDTKKIGAVLGLIFSTPLCYTLYKSIDDPNITFIIADILFALGPLMEAFMIKRACCEEKEIKKVKEFLKMINLKPFSNHRIIEFDKDNNPILFNGVKSKGELNIATLNKYSLSDLKKIRENALKRMGLVLTKDSFTRTRDK